MQSLEKNKNFSLITRMRRRWTSLLTGVSNREGQSTTEYILILAIVVMIASKMRGSLMNSSTKILQNFDNKTEQFFQDPN